MKSNHVAYALGVILFVGVAGTGTAQTTSRDADTISASPRLAPSLGLAVFRRPLGVDFGFRYNRPGFASHGPLSNPGRSWLAASISPLTVVNAAWIGGNSDWNTAGNWTPTGVPKNGAGNTYNVTINSGGSDVVNLDIASTIASLTLGGAVGSSTLNSYSGDALTITGAFTVGAGGSLILSGAGSNLTAGTLSNSGGVTIGSGTTLTLTNQTSGITDVVAGSSVSVAGTFNAGANNGLYKLNSVEGMLLLNNGATTNITPGSGTLTVASGASVITSNGVSAGTNLTVNGNLSNAGEFWTSYYSSTGFTDTFTLTGALTNQTGGTLYIGSAYENSSSTVNVGALTNSGSMYIYDSFGGGNMVTASTLTNTGSLSIGSGDTLHLTSQANGITDVVAGSSLDVAGTFTAGANNGLYKLNSVEGTLTVENGQTTNVTPGSGTLTVASSGELRLNSGATPTILNVTGNVDNSGTVYENGGNTLTATGGFTNEAGAYFNVGGGSGNDVASMHTLTNNGALSIGNGATLTLTNQTSGITDVVAGSSVSVAGTFNAGANNGLYKLNSVEGSLTLDNGATTNITPGSGTLTVASGASVITSNGVSAGTNLTVNGNLSNAGEFWTSYYSSTGFTDTFTLTGALTNQTGGTLYIGSAYENSSSTVNVGALTNSGSMYIYDSFGGGNMVTASTLTNTGSLSIGNGDTLHLTSQANGITDVVAGSSLDVAGTFTAGANNGLYKLNSVEGTLTVENGQTTNVTPGSGTLTVASSGELRLNSGATPTILNVTGNVDNSGTVYENGGNTLTATGGFTNEAGAYFNVGGGSGNDVASMHTLTNNGALSIGNGATLTLTNQANGITDVVAGSSVSVAGTFNAGANNALYKLNSVEGSLTLDNGATTNITPGSGTLTVASGATVFTYNGVSAGTNLTVNGNLSNAGEFWTSYYSSTGFTDTFTLTGALTNQTGGTLYIGSAYENSPSTVNVGALTNNGSMTIYDSFGGGNMVTASTLTNTGSLSIGNGDTLNLTSQANGITDVVAGSSLDVAGTFTAGANNGLYKLNSVEGTLTVENGQTTNVTPGSGTLTVASSGELRLNSGATPTILNVTGNVDNSGTVYENGGNTLTATGGFTNEAGAYFNVGGGSGNDVASMHTLTNNGALSIGNGATLTLTNQANGITDVVAGSSVSVAGTFNAGANNALYKLNSVEGSLTLDNGATTNITPGSGTLTVASGASVITYNGVSAGTNLTVNGNLSNAGEFWTSYYSSTGFTDTFTLTGALTNQTGGTLYIGSEYENSPSTVNVGALTNNGSMTIYDSFGGGNMVTASTLTNTGSLSIGNGDTLNLTASGTNTNSAAIAINGGTLEISGASVNLAGAGTITLSPSTNSAAITGNGAGVVLTSANTIEGTGTISGLGLVNNGTILANQSTPLTILPNSSGLTNNGTLSVLKGDTLQIGTSAGGALTNFSGSTLTGGTYTVGGTLQFGAPGTNIVTDAATISLTGAGAEIMDFGGSNVLKNLATITGAGSLTLGTSYGTFTTTGSFTNNGLLSIGTGDKFIVDLADSLTNFSGTTLSGGAYNVSGTLQFSGAKIVTNNASITLTGASSNIYAAGNVNGLANFAVNNGSFTLGSKRNFTTAGNFTNNGSLKIAAGDTFDIAGSLTNLTAGALNSGTYNLSGTLESAGANIVTNSGNITLASTTAKFWNSTSSTNALLGFNTNTASGAFTLSGNANLSTTGGSFTNAGLFTVSTGSTFTVGGSATNFTQTAGTITVDGILTNTGAGSLNLNGGALFGTGTLDYGVVDTATITPGASATSTGKLLIDGTYAQNSGGALDVTIAGTTAGTKFDQLNVSGAADLSGTLNITLAAGYTPKVGNTFDILNASSVTGDFTTINGLAINSKEHFTVTVVSGDEIELTVVKGAAPTDSATLTPSSQTAPLHAGRYGLGVYGGHYLLPSVLAPSLARIPAPASMVNLAQTPRMPFGPAASLSAGARGFRPMDEFGLPVSPVSTSDAGASASLGISPVSAAASNSMAAMNHMRFECGVDLKALLKTSRKQLVRALWASPDSPEALSIGYMNYTASH